MVGRLTGMLFVCLFWLSAPVLAQTPVDNARIWPATDHTRLVLETGDAVERSLFALESPDRLVIDIEQADLKTDLSALDLSETPIKRIRTGRRKGGELRVVLDMKEKVEPVKHIVDIAEEAMEQVGITPIIKPIRGGTDGAQLSFMGLPCPNIFAGGHNFHGKYEYVPVESMQKAVEVIVKITELTAKKYKR